MIRIKKNDTVILKKGKDKGKTGKVLLVNPMKKIAIVERINLVKKSIRPSQIQPKGGFLEIEAPVQLSNLQLICTRCNQPTRVKFDFFEKTKKVRRCKKCNEIIDKI